MSRLLPAPWSAAARATVAAAAMALLAGCASSTPAAPALHVERSHRAGRALGEAPAAVASAASAASDGADASGSPAAAPAAAPALDADPSAALALTIEWYWMPTGPDDGLAPVGVHALAVAGSGGDDPFTAAPLIVGAVRVALGEPARDVADRLRSSSWGGASVASGSGGASVAERARLLATQDDALPVGATAVLDPGALALELSRPSATSGVELALVRDGQVPMGRVRRADAVEEAVEGDDAESDADAERRAESEHPVAWREVVLLDTNLVPGGPPAVIALPGGGKDAQLVALIEVHAAPTEADGNADALAQHAALLAQCLADVAESARLAAAQADAMDAVESKHRQLLAAARSMAEDGDRRRAAVFLASESGAGLALDTVLVAQTAELDELVAAWRKAGGGGDQDDQLVQGDRLTWGLERTTALWLAQRSESSALSAELEAVLLRQTGVVARSPGLLQQFAEECDGLQSWRARLEQENRLALEDSLPGARVRAFDWLAARELAPAGYDPLAPRAERQAALLAAEEAP